MYFLQCQYTSKITYMTDKPEKLWLVKSEGFELGHKWKTFTVQYFPHDLTAYNFVWLVFLPF